jgi:transcriptional regulator with XRE-family HTH domain
MSFAKQLEQVMSDKGMSQAELATRIGKGKSSVSQYLSGKNIPKKDVQEKIAEVLECTVEFLNLGFDEIGDIDESKNISVAECAKILGKSEQFVRVALQTGVAPFGFAVKNRTMYSYHISPKKLNEYINA